jgi:hypothetical protein
MFLTARRSAGASLVVTDPDIRGARCARILPALLTVAQLYTRAMSTYVNTPPPIGIAPSASRDVVGSDKWCGGQLNRAVLNA